MRLKEDSSSYRAMGLKAKLKPIPDRIRRPRKSTARWCKGKVGVEHDYQMQVPKNDHNLPGRPAWRRFNICTRCGKQSYKGVQYWCEKHQEWGNHASWEHDHNLKCLQ